MRNLKLSDYRPDYRLAWLVAAAVIAPLLSAGEARAYDVEINAETIGQGYQLVNGDGSITSRRGSTGSVLRSTNCSDGWTPKPTVGS